MTRKDIPSLGEMQVIEKMAEQYISQVQATRENAKPPTVAELCLKAFAGWKYGLSPLESFDKVSVYWPNEDKQAGVRKPTIQPHASLYLQLLRQHPDHDYQILKSDNDECIVKFCYRRPSGEWERHDHKLDRKTVDELGYSKSKNGIKAIWRSHPAKMLLWATVRSGVRKYAPDIWAVDDDDVDHGDEPFEPSEPIPSVRDDVDNTGPEASTQPARVKMLTRPTPGVEEGVDAESEYQNVMAYLRGGEQHGYAPNANWPEPTGNAVRFAYMRIAQHHKSPTMPSDKEIAKMKTMTIEAKVKALLGFDANKGGQK